MKTFAILSLVAAVMAKTDYAGCTSSAVGASLLWYVPESGEICKQLDCGGGRAPPKTNVPGCAAYEGTETYTPSFIPNYGQATATPEVKPTTSSAPGVSSAYNAISSVPSSAAAPSSSAPAVTSAPTYSTAIIGTAIPVPSGNGTAGNGTSVNAPKPTQSGALSPNAAGVVGVAQGVVAVAVGVFGVMML
ncbi:unnamed protein product [Periconia digitata]|uniref:Uncharacterized protein n=1 Tax=Periconia digitata TaxID=1303443 RepID=A0A9W4XQS6_9PLEO|nr:unnamed protein product [Periconia digitata]